MITAPPGKTLEQLSQVNQELLDGLLKANPGFSAQSDVGGQRIKWPQGESTVEDHIPQSSGVKRPRSTFQWDAQASQLLHEEGNLTALRAKSRAGGIHKQPEITGELESLQARQRCQAIESAFLYQQTNVPLTSSYAPGYYAWALEESAPTSYIDPFTVTAETLKQTGTRYNHAASALITHEKALLELSRRPGGASLAELQELSTSTLQKVDQQLGKGAAWSYAFKQIPNLDLVKNGLGNTATLPTDMNGRVSSELVEGLAKRSGSAGAALFSVVSSFSQFTRTLPIIDAGFMVVQAGGHLMEGNTWEAKRTAVKWGGGFIGGWAGGFGGAIIGEPAGPIGVITGGVIGAIYVGNEGSNFADEWYLREYPKNPSVSMEHIDKTFEYNAPLLSAPPPHRPGLFGLDY